VGSSEQAGDIDGCLLGRIVPHFLRTHENLLSRGEDLLTRHSSEARHSKYRRHYRGLSPLGVRGDTGLGSAWRQASRRALVVAGPPRPRRSRTPRARVHRTAPKSTGRRPTRAAWTSILVGPSTTAGSSTSFRRCPLYRFLAWFCTIGQASGFAPGFPAAIRWVRCRDAATAVTAGSGGTRSPQTRVTCPALTPRLGGMLRVS
jgi:hypothetical protein